MIMVFEKLKKCFKYLKTIFFKHCLIYSVEFTLLLSCLLTGAGKQ